MSDDNLKIALCFFMAFSILAFYQSLKNDLRIMKTQGMIMDILEKQVQVMEKKCRSHY